MQKKRPAVHPICFLFYNVYTAYIIAKNPESYMLRKLVSAASLSLLVNAWDGFIAETGIEMCNLRILMIVYSNRSVDA